ncbi:MAG TPA: DUF5916 domain-containing protein [Gemmatimonadales bacterium]|nr:DUF5916 domain-containing protein [Gemmatimonadales bacterium]
MLVALLCVLCVPRQGPAALDSLRPPAPDLRAVRAARPVVIDGALNDDIWQTATRISRFTQRDPVEGAAPTESTVVYVAYDDAALYIAARMYDDHPDSIVARLGRRDAVTNSDRFTVYLDTYHDRRSGFYFGIDAAGTLSDGTLMNDDWNDDTWDGVWEGKARIDSLGWTAEVRIPYSQLRFLKADRYVWGANFRRDVARKNESDLIVYTPKNSSGFVSRFPDLLGIERITPPARMEVLPYVTSKAEFAPHTAGDPFFDGSRYTPAIGADLKVGLGSNLTLDATVNPDFGQVEVDPAVVNLSDVETFFNEKRPFFVEGSSIFDFGQGGTNNNWGFNWGNPQFFYSRRIGRPPQGSLPDADYSDVPSGTHILGALKLTGKAFNSWNVGAVSAITNREMADLDTSGVRFRAEVEPLTYYGVYRAQKEFGQGRQGLGFIGTVAARHFDDTSMVSQLNRSSVAFGVDGWTALDKDKTWVTTGWLGVSDVHGSRARILDLQQSSGHYFQQPDARYVHVDSSATSLTGLAGRFALNKQRGNWYVNSAVGFISPGFDVNDVGFQFRTGFVNGHFVGGYRWTTPGKVFRAAELYGAAFRSYDYDGNMIWTGVFSNGWAQLRNFYQVNFDVAYNPWTISNRRTRGGPLMLTPPGYQFDGMVQSDSRKFWMLMLMGGTYQSVGDRNWYLSPSIELRPAPNVDVTVGPNFSQDATPEQYVGTFADSNATQTFGNRYLFATLHQTEVSAGIRVNWTYTPKLSLQVYAQPLVSAGAYSDFKALARPRSWAFDHYSPADGTFDTTTYTAYPEGPGGPALAVGNPNFNFRSLRGNAVLRWEYSPGSTLYLVWTQTRTDQESIGAFDFGPSLHRLAQAKPDNIFLVKFTYWWNP